MRGILVISLFLSILPIDTLARSLPYLDSDFSCISTEMARRYVDDFNINIENFGGFELCNEEVDIKKLFNDLHLIEQGKFTGQAQNIFINNIIDRSRYYSWLKEMTYGINRRQDIPHATAYNVNGYFIIQDAWAALSTLGRVGVLIHEARHTHGYNHVGCLYGPYQGLSVPGCDHTLESEGAHSVEMEYYARVVLQGQNFHPVYSSMARTMNLARSNFVFNRGPMTIREALLTITRDKARLFDKDNEIVFPLTDTTDYLLKRTSAGATLFNGTKTLVIDMYSPVETLYQDDYSYYKIHNLDFGVPHFKDFEEFDMGPKRYVVGLTYEDQLYSFNFRQAKWFPPTKIRGAQFLSTTSPEGERGLFVIREDQSLCAYNPKQRRCHTLNISWPDHVLNYAFHKRRLIELRENGLMYDVETKILLRESPVHQFVNVPLYDAYKNHHLYKRHKGHQSLLTPPQSRAETSTRP